MLAPGATGQFTAIAERSDGTSEDVTKSATWNIWWTGPDRNHSGPNALSLIAPGMVQGLAPGEAYVNVQLPSQSHTPATSPTLSVLVLEPGTFRISGTVTAAGVPELAVIEVVAGVGAGLRTTTGEPAGQFALYGAAGPVELRVSASGFAQQTRRLAVTGDTTSNFELGLLEAPTDVSGSWAAVLSAAPACRANTPGAAWEREFNLDINQQGTRLSITRVSQSFWESCTVAHGTATEQGRIFGRALSFVIVGDTYGNDYSYPCLFDRLSPTQWLGLSGLVEGTVTGSIVHGTMNTAQGAFDLYETAPTATEPYGTAPKSICHAPDHTLVLRRRS